MSRIPVPSRQVPSSPSIDFKENRPFSPDHSFSPSHNTSNPKMSSSAVSGASGYRSSPMSGAEATDTRKRQSKRDEVSGCAGQEIANANWGAPAHILSLPFALTTAGHPQEDRSRSESQSRQAHWWTWYARSQFSTQACRHCWYRLCPAPSSCSHRSAEHQRGRR